MMMTNSNVLQPPIEQKVTFEWRLDMDSDEREAKQRSDALQSNGGEAHVHSSPKSLFPIPIVIFGAVMAVALIEQVSDWWTNRKKNGTLIQVGVDGKIDIRPINVPYGVVFFIGADGKTCEFTDVSKDQMKDILASASRGIIPSGGSSTQSQSK